SIIMPLGLQERKERAVGEFIPRFHDIPGNAPLETKELVEQWLNVFSNRGAEGFGTRSAQPLELVEISILPMANEPQRQEARVVLELTVSEDMLNGGGKMHGACIVLLADICTSFTMAAMSHASGGSGTPGVSQSINTIYHAPASLGDKLRLINTSTSIGKRTTSARIEIWDVTHHRLVASATQVQMTPSSKL
ncbi:HotDog domain-containing protein, partial [Melanogaster broomeanus]